MCVGTFVCFIYQEMYYCGIQFFCDQVSELVQLKHMLLVRWTRFSAHSQLVENVYHDFQQYMK